jgi:hypothetical protein
MPNECWSKLTIGGPEADVQSFVERVVSDDLDYDDRPERKPGRVVYFMTTGWEAPIPWLEATAAAEPSLTFEHEYMYEFDEVVHRTYYEAGELVSDDEVEALSLEWVTEIEK